MSLSSPSPCASPADRSAWTEWVRVSLIATAVTPRAASLVTKEPHRVGVRGGCTPACRHATHPSVEPGAIRMPRRRADVQGAHAQHVGHGPEEVLRKP
jgi:hypothetical protein